MTRSAEGSQPKSANHREDIVQSALAMFARHGYTGASVRRIAAEAGVSRSLMYNWFPAKRELLRAIFERSMGQVQRTLEAADGDGPSADRLRRLVDAALGLVRADPLTWRFVYQLRMQPDVLAELGRDVPAHWAALEPRIAALLAGAGAGDPATEARALVAALDGGVQQYLLDPEHYPLREVGEVLARRFAPAGGAASPGSPRPMPSAQAG
ncbi:MAG TPA: TetR/AcrR family transcriptional regulator [Longimicrobiaceae bacterium]|nr:TetR/AcrR family transcriptional regulator [Longimicrobiaceae bacterium]